MEVLVEYGADPNLETKVRILFLSAPIPRYDLACLQQDGLGAIDAAYGTAYGIKLRLSKHVELGMQKRFKKMRELKANDIGAPGDEL